MKETLRLTLSVKEEFDFKVTVKLTKYNKPNVVQQKSRKWTYLDPVLKLGYL